MVKWSRAVEGTSEPEAGNSSEKIPLTNDNNEEKTSASEREIQIYGRELPKGYSKKFGPRRRSIHYVPCDLQKQEDTPYYVSLAARVMGIETEDDTSRGHINTMDLPFDWLPNERISEEQFNATNNLTLWTCMPTSVTSVNLTICLAKELHDEGTRPQDFFAAWACCAAMPLFVAFFIELSIVTALSKDYSNIHEEAQDNFCQQKLSLQCGVVGIFLISLLKPLYDILTEIFVGISSKRCVYDTIALQQLFLHGAGAYWGKGKKWVDTSSHKLIVKEVETGPLSWVIFWISVAVETYIFYLTVVVGIYYTLSQQDASSIVQAAVAISFVNEIDNLLYEAISTHEVKDVMTSCHYEVPMVQSNSFSGENFFHFAFRQHQLLLQVPILAIITCAIVFTLRYAHCEDYFEGGLFYE